MVIIHDFFLQGCGHPLAQWLLASIIYLFPTLNFSYWSMDLLKECLLQDFNFIAFYGEFCAVRNHLDPHNLHCKFGRYVLPWPTIEKGSDRNLSLRLGKENFAFNIIGVEQKVEHLIKLINYASFDAILQLFLCSVQRRGRASCFLTWITIIRQFRHYGSELENTQNLNKIHLSLSTRPTATPPK